MKPLYCLWLLATAGAAVLPKRSSNACINPESQKEFVVRNLPLIMPDELKSADIFLPTQFNSHCPKKIVVDRNGNCPVASGHTRNGCTTYCEAEVQWFFGQEVPFDDAQCSAYSTCTFSQAYEVTVTNTYEFDGGISLKIQSAKSLESAFNVGASYSYSISKSTTEMLKQTRPRSTLAYCGYWTFLPYYIRSELSLQDA